MPVLRMYRQKVDAPGLIGKRGGPNNRGAIPHNQSLPLEAAKLLVFSEKPIIEIALIAGYESQQAFSSIFKTMYKQTPLEYRQNEVFYPLQLEFTLNKNPTAPDTIMQEISYATLADIPDWMNFITQQSARFQ